MGALPTEVIIKVWLKRKKTLWCTLTALLQYAPINFLRGVFFLILKWTTLPSCPVTFKLMCSLSGLQSSIWNNNSTHDKILHEFLSVHEFLSKQGTQIWSNSNKCVWLYACAWSFHVWYAMRVCTLACAQLRMYTYLLLCDLKTSSTASWL